MTSKALVVVTGLCSVFLAQSASAQPRWGRERVPSQGACFYEDTNFHGNYFCVRQGDRLPSLPSGMSDRISSLRVFGNAEVTVFRDGGMRGRSARFINDVRNLKGEGWNDSISSLDVESGRDYRGYGGYGNDRNDRDDRNDRNNGRNRDRGGVGGWINRLPIWGRNEQMPREGACFYEDRDFRGQYFCVPRGATYESLPRGFNDRISSVRVFGADVRIFQDSNFRGRSQDIRNDVSNLRGNWRDNVSSIRVF